MSLHSAFYETRGTKAGAVVHLHSHYSVALSMMEDVDENDMLPPMTPYPIMKFGRVKLLPYFMPGDAAMGDAVRDLHGQHSAIVLANHGPVVTAGDIHSAVYAMEELEASARLALELHGQNPRMLSKENVLQLSEIFTS